MGLFLGSIFKENEKITKKELKINNRMINSVKSELFFAIMMYDSEAVSTSQEFIYILRYKPIRNLYSKNLSRCISEKET